MSHVVFVVSLLAILIVIAASLLALVSEEFEFFPPPSKNSWQYYVFWLLFRIMFIGLIILSFSTFNPQPFFNNWIRYFLSLPLMVLGFGAATYLSVKLGWENAHGEKRGLVVTGVYRWSRNPIYVASFVGMMGWGLFVNSCYVAIILSLWAFMYLLAPFVEEPWLERTYADEFLAYKRKSSRFFGPPEA